ncbi:hypothetical protein I7V27_12650 [Lelliottia amnigena]|jgi:hypothetical protein|uniref:Uncharacterized protein n=1 Tax=Lelliottia amnigena TaxID=61646 RepID=A0AAP2AF69_LELAM|nr:hypothetical protein [Lelliottia amnigena]MBL5899773.1 hypothetical protein [Lelliottia amnigena]MBL5935287.1 hypothetical protein [Lelliottia amnigena]
MTKEPVVTITSSCSQEELLEYLRKKVRANTCLEAAIAQRQLLLLELKEVEARIDELTSAAALEFVSDVCEVEINPEIKDASQGLNEMEIKFPCAPRPGTAELNQPV